MLKLIQKELTSLLQANTNTVGVYKWIKTIVNSSLYSDLEFVAMLTTWCVCVCMCMRACLFFLASLDHISANANVYSQV